MSSRLYVEIHYCSFVRPHRRGRSLKSFFIFGSMQTMIFLDGLHPLSERVHQPHPFAILFLLLSDIDIDAAGLRFEAPSVGELIGSSCRSLRVGGTRGP